MRCVRTLFLGLLLHCSSCIASPEYSASYCIANSSNILNASIAIDSIDADISVPDTIATYIKPDSILTTNTLSAVALSDTLSQSASRAYPAFLDRFGGFGRFVGRIIAAFDNIDTTYIERIHYNFTAMAQATTNYEAYALGTPNRNEFLSFTQHPDFRLGPYFGWRWLVLGYTYDMTSIGANSFQRGSKVEFSIYSSMVGVDFIWRRTGSDFFLSHVRGLGDEAQEYEGHDISNYLSTKITGINAYYVFNHRKFSNPAIYSQGTIQRRSAGSWQIGANVTAHEINFNYDALPKELFKESGSNTYSTLEHVKYINYSVNAGYSYNWVFHRGWCFGISLMPALSYKFASMKSNVYEGDDTDNNIFKNKVEENLWRRGNFNIDITGRTGIIYNTGRWFTGFFVVMHDYNYRRDDIVYINVFGTANICGGFYFQRRKN